MERNDQTTPLWSETATVPRPAPLAEHIRVQACVVGAGIAGLTTAYLLARAGRSVVVLDDGPIAGGQTQRTTAHLSNYIDAGYHAIERLHGRARARLVAESHTAAIHRIGTIARDEDIACEFERLDGYLFSAPHRKDGRDTLAREIDAAHRAGLREAAWVARAPLEGFDTGPCLRFPGQAQFHPVKYAAGLARAIERDGGLVVPGTHVTRVEGGTPARVHTARGITVTADAVVIATNTPINNRFSIHTKQTGYMTYVVGALVPHGSVARALYWDTEHPYHYVRLHGSGRNGDEGDTLIVGGEDHRTGQAADPVHRHDRLEAWARTRFPMIRDVRYRWSGQVRESVDGLAFIGRNPLDRRNVYVATGDSGMGMTHGTIAGILLSDMIAGRGDRHPWAAVYSPSRLRVRALGTYLRENLNTARQYVRWLKTWGRKTEADLRGTGAVLEHGATRLAVSWDERDRMHRLSAVCPHLGGIVRWNELEHTWDCPAHGSRYDRLGRVICGPANRDLSPAAEPARAAGVTRAGGGVRARPAPVPARPGRSPAGPGIRPRRGTGASASRGARWRG